MPFVDTDDIADVVVEALLKEQHNGAIYNLTGPRTMTLPEAVNEIANAIGRPIDFTPITLSAYSKMLASFGMSEDYIYG
ncbi:MAG: hypothetical protein R2728_13525 [Chitinophagales bacterium]